MFFATLFAAVLLVLWLFKTNRDYYVLAFFAKRVKTIDGTPVEKIAPSPKQKTIFGHTFDMIGFNSEKLFSHSRQLAQELRKSFVEYFLSYTIYNIITAEDAEMVLADVNLIRKGVVYTFLQPFIRTGLLTSTDEKWHRRRKMLTPAFHFNILEQFEEIFKEESKKFVKQLEKSDDDVISLSALIPKFTLNNVCETALGVELDEYLDGDCYRKSFKMIEECFVKRMGNPFYLSDILFNLLEGRKYEPHLKTVHEFSSSIIEKRRRLFAVQESKEHAKQNVENDDFEFTNTSKKKRYAMLDTLLNAESEGLIDHIGICEEVDTFMFEGFDTTSMGLIFGLMNMSLYPDMQERCYQEIIENIDEDLSNLSLSQLANLKYLECFLKESLRLYPPVPVIQREAMSEVKLANKLILPAGTGIVIHIFDIHRNPKNFPNPNDFDPERFTAENSAGRHPYGFIPFSAGQRNCIGQKFAMLEMKTLMVYVLKNFKILPMMKSKEVAFESGIILRSLNNIKVKLIKRI